MGISGTVLCVDTKHKRTVIYYETPLVFVAHLLRIRIFRILNMVPKSFSCDPDRFDNPNDYDPDRVFGEQYEVADKNRLLMGFSYGVHKCPGTLMATNEVRVSALSFHNRGF